MISKLARLIAVAKGELPADLILANARIVNVFTGEIEPGNVAICGDRVAGVGSYTEGKQVLDIEGKYLAPGFINGHTHLESSMLDIGQYARAIVPHGTLAIITDLHEIANVAGLDGLRYMIGYSRRLPLELFLMAPSCVPTTNLETPGASLGAGDIRQVLRWRRCIGLGEVMNFPGVLTADSEVLRKIELAAAKIVDGHAPGLTGKNLNAYIAAGIYSDHESVSLAEAMEKLARGMWVMVREGSSERNLQELLPLVNDRNYRRCFFVVDDRSCSNLLREGDIDGIIRKAIQLGLEPVRAIQMATINTAEYFGLDRLGAIAPAYFANLVIISDLSNMSIEMVLHRGWPVARAGEPLFHLPRTGPKLADTINIKPFSVKALQMPASEKEHPIIELVPGQLVTRKRAEKVVRIPDIERDILKLVVVERHRASGNIGRGLVKGFGLKCGALASSVAHDSHNIIAVGTSDADIITAIKEVERLHGGLVVCLKSKILASLPLPIAGLMSDEPLETVVSRMDELEHVVRELGTTYPYPFATLSFLALPVIPELRLTDLGLVDVTQFKLIK